MGGTTGDVAPSQLPVVERRGDGKDSTLQGDRLAHVGCKLLQLVRLPARRDWVKDRSTMQYNKTLVSREGSICRQHL